MIVVVTEEKKKEKETEFPCLMVADNGLIVLFTLCNEGSVVCVGNSPHSLGYVSEDWHMDSFKEFKGSVELKN